MYSTRGALALLWRGATTGPDGAQLWSDDELATAKVLVEQRLATLTTQPYMRDGQQQTRTLLHLTHTGNQLWERVLDLVEDTLTGKGS